MPGDERAQDHDVCEDYIRRRAVLHLEKGRITISPPAPATPSSPPTPAPRCVRSRSAPTCCSRRPRSTSLRQGSEEAHRRRALRHPHYDEVISRDLHVMDTAAFALCRDSRLPLRISTGANPACCCASCAAKASARWSRRGADRRRSAHRCMDMKKPTPRSVGFSFAPNVDGPLTSSLPQAPPARVRRCGARRTGTAWRSRRSGSRP